ncbi:MAG: bifunctional phosphoribosylaminoimidazolecarboxamide formyltransferase/IMP cyclohydrolase [Nitrospinota bacterium]
MNVKNIKRAVISVSDKTGVVELARALKEKGAEILSTGGTAKLLTENGIDVTKVSDFTGFPEILDGRVKTLHPKIHGGILARRSDDTHIKQMKEHDIEPIDMVVINLYPFEATVTKEGATEQDAVENIDIGGPSMIRSAAKNFADVAVVTDPDDYPEVISDLKNSGGLTLEKRKAFSIKAFGRTSEYDRAIHEHFSEKSKSDESLTAGFKKVSDLRYGENPHQSASFFVKTKDEIYTGENQLHGKELSYNNIVDLDAALQHVREYDRTACVIIKHTNPCGVALDDHQADAYKKALSCDPVSAFGGIIGFNRPVTADTAMELSKLFLEAVIAPDYEDDALAILKKKKNLRLIKPKNFSLKQHDYIKCVVGGLLYQSPDNVTLYEKTLKVVSKRQPTKEEMESMKFAWTVAKHVKSNAIIFARDSVTVGIGAGQMSRVDSSKIAVSKAQSPVKGCVMASDAFFPFRDGIDAAGMEGITAVIQPGGSVRDEEVIAAADEYDMAMVFTGIRHFRH